MLSLILKYVLPVIAVLAILFGAVEYGKSVGHTAGYTEAWDAQQKTIQAMVYKDNAQTEAQNKKITDLETNAAKDASDLFAANAAAATTRATIITKYEKANPVVAASCGWDIPTVDAINDVIESDPNNAAIENDPINQAAAAYDVKLTPANDPTVNGSPPVPASPITASATGASQ